MNNLQIQFKGLIFKNIVTAILLTFTFNNCLFSKILPNDSIYVQSLYNSSKLLYTNGNYTKAIEHLQEILNLKKKQGIDSEPQYFKVYNRLGLIYYEKGQLRKAIEGYNLALNNTMNPYYQSAINDNIANVYSLLGDYTKAIHYLENSIIILEKSTHQNKNKKIINNYHNQGYAYYQSGQYKLALQKSLKSMLFAKENKQKINGTSYSNCGLTYKNLDSLDKADFYFKKAIQAYKNEFGRKHYMTAIAYLNHAVFYAETNQYDKSEKLFNKSYHILTSILGYKHYYTALCLKNTGDLFYKKQDYNKALHCYQQALNAKIHEFNDSSIYQNPANNIYPDLDLLDILNAKAKAFEKMANKENQEQNLKAALQTLQLSVGFIEQLRTGYLFENSKLQLAAKEHESYLAIVEVAYSLYEITKNRAFAETAFTYAELSKYTLLRELENEEKAKDVAGIPDTLINKEQSLKEQISYLGIQLKNEQEFPAPNKDKVEELQQKLFQISKELEGLNERLETSYPLYYKQKYQNFVLSSKQIQKSISNKDAIIEYVVADTCLYTFILTKEQFVFDKQVMDSTFFQSLEFYTKVLYRLHLSNYYQYRSAAYYLYQKLIQPYETFIKNKNLVIVPDQKLLLISFDALIDKPYKKTDNPDYRKESYLLRKYAISYAYTSTLHQHNLTKKNNFFQNFLGIAPGYENSNDSLVHIPLGLENVKKLSWLTQGKALTGENATKKAFKENAGKSDIIHFYAHGFEDTLNPANSKLCLAPSGKSDNGYLYAWEVYNMKLNANLVVLASCYSGKGAFSKGEGVLSIARSFIYAGSKSIITSLWSASYIPANKILTGFYKYSFKGRSKTKALQLAKLDFLEESNSYSAHPMFWSGIVLYGNSAPLYCCWYIKRVVVIILFVFLVILIIKKRKILIHLFKNF